MPNIELPIRSLSILFLIGAIIAILWFPNNPHTPDLARALFWWFLALGVVRWVETGILRLFENNDGNIHKAAWYPIVIFAFASQVAFLIIGIRYFLSVLANL